MAPSMHHIGRILCRISPSILQPLRQYQSLRGIPGQLCLRTSPFILPSHSFCDEASATKASQGASRYNDKPWAYLESEEYIAKYGTMCVWTGYRRNHKGGIPPQKTRKTCIRGGKTCGNPCPICRDPKIVVHPQNVKLLEQFIHSETGVVYDPTQTGVCMKQQKMIINAVNSARDQGFLTFQIPHVQYSEQDLPSSHDAVGKTPPPPTLIAGESWYKWYDEITPDKNEVAKVKKIYRDYLK